MPVHRYRLKSDCSLQGSKALLLGLLFGAAWVDPLLNHLLTQLIPGLPGLLQRDLGVRTHAVVLLLAVLGGRKTVPPDPVLTTSWINLQVQPATVRDTTPFGAWLLGLDFGVS